MFFNTTNISGPTLFDSLDKASAQDEVILNYFKQNPHSLFSPCDVWKKLFTSDTPITSCRRSISGLTRSGHLLKTDQFKTGIFGKKVFLWKLNLQNQ